MCLHGLSFQVVSAIPSHLDGKSAPGQLPTGSVCYERNGVNVIILFFLHFPVLFLMQSAVYGAMMLVFGMSKIVCGLTGSVLFDLHPRRCGRKRFFRYWR